MTDQWLKFDYVWEQTDTQTATKIDKWNKRFMGPLWAKINQ